MADSTPTSYSSDPRLWLYTSLSSGSSHIVTATSRLETILKANKIPFQALDVATDEKARMLWGRRAKSRKLPGLVRMGMVLADLEEVEEWNEYGEIQENLGAGSLAPAASTPTPSMSNTPSKPPAAPSQPAAKDADTVASTDAAPSTAENTSSSTESKEPPSSETKPAAEAPAAEAKPAAPAASEAKSPPPGAVATPFTVAMRGIGFEVAEKAKAAKQKLASTTPNTTSSSSAAEATPSRPDAKDCEEAKLDNSGPTGMPPPSGEASAEDAAAPETAGAVVESKADKVPATAEDSKGTEAAGAKEGETTVPKPESAAADEPQKDTANSDAPVDTEKEPDSHESTQSNIAAPLELTDPNAGTEIPEMASEPTEVVQLGKESEAAKVDDATEASIPSIEEKAETHEDKETSKELTSPKASGEAELHQSTESKEAADSTTTGEETKDPTSNEAAAESSTSLNSPPDGEQTIQHRGSSISPASKEEIKRIEDEQRIEEDPNEDSDEFEGGAKEETTAAKEDQEELHGNDAPKASTVPEPEVKKEADHSHLSPDSADQAAAAAPTAATTTDAGSKEAHVQFIGEADGDERDRVKATLRRNSPDGREPTASIMHEPTEAAKHAEKEETEDNEAATAANTGANTGAAGGAAEDEEQEKGTETETKKEDPQPASESAAPPASAAAATTAKTTTTEEKPAATKAEKAESAATETQAQAAADPTKVGDSVAD